MRPPCLPAGRQLVDHDRGSRLFFNASLDGSDAPETTHFLIIIIRKPNVLNPYACFRLCVRARLRVRVGGERGTLCVL